MMNYLLQIIILWFITILTNISIVSSKINNNYFSMGLSKKILHKKMHDVNFLGTTYLNIQNTLISQSNVNIGTYATYLAQNPNLVKNQTSIIVLNNFQNVQYFGNLFVGSERQKLSIIFDSGSNILWLPSKDCLTCREFSSKFDYMNSNSFFTPVNQVNRNISVIN